MNNSHFEVNKSESNNSELNSNQMKSINWQLDNYVFAPINSACQLISFTSIKGNCENRLEFHLNCITSSSFQLLVSSFRTFKLSSLENAALQL
jgi:hypothetical protein